MGSSNDQTIALTYRRVSTYHQERDGVSLDVQTSQVIDYIRRQPGWRLGPDFQDTLSGRRADRPNYQRLLDEARALRRRGERVVIVAAALDRLGRDLEESVRSRKELKALGVPLYVIREGGEMSDLHANIVSSIAQDEAERIKARVKGSRQHNRERGYRSTSRAPWGYQWVATSEVEREAGRAPLHVLRADPKTAPYLKQAWQRAASGESVRAVARWISGLTSVARGGRTLGYGNVLAMFKNPTYIARVTPPERRSPAPDLAALKLPQGRWEALIDDATWTAVQEGIARHQRMPKQARGEYLLTGLLTCPRCRLRMQGRNHPSARLYSCSTPGKGCWFGGRADLIDGAMLDKIAGLLDGLGAGLRADVRAGLRAEWARMQRPPKRASQGRTTTLERVISRARKRQDEVLRLLADKVIDRERYDRFVAQEQADITAAEKELVEIRAVEAPTVLPPLDDMLKRLGGWRARLAQGTIREQRAILDELVIGIVPQRIGRSRYDVDVAWSPLAEALRSLAEHRVATEPAVD